MTYNEILVFASLWFWYLAVGNVTRTMQVQALMLVSVFVVWPIAVIQQSGLLAGWLYILPVFPYIGKIFHWW